ncbi:MAG: hypothetical protein R3B09_26160 [Nannocystaceae bacterium]
MRPSHPAASLLLAAACAATDEPLVLAGEGSPTVCESAAYLQQRRAMNYCEEDDDCVEIVPEPCFTPYYGNAATASSSLRDVERELAGRCGVVTTPGCPRPPLGVPRCRLHRCVPGRLDRETRRLCWSIRIPLLEFGHGAVIYSRPSHPPIPDASRSAHVRLDEPGTLTLRIEPRKCALSEIELTDRASGRILTFPAGAETMTLTEELDAGEYVVLARGPGPSCPIEVTAELHRAGGAPVPAKYHGLRYSVACE